MLNRETKCEGVSGHYIERALCLRRMPLSKGMELKPSPGHTLALQITCFARFNSAVINFSRAIIVATPPKHETLPLEA